MSRPLSSSLLTGPNQLHPHISYAERTPSGHFYEVTYALHVSALLVLSAYSRKGPAFPTLQSVLHADTLVGSHANTLIGLHAEHCC